jgi:AAA15 family ATPase/GTPase
MIVKSVSIRNFRSIESVQVQCSDIVGFYGSNDAGKSNILRALNLFFNNQTDYQTNFDFRADFNAHKQTPKQKAKEVIVELVLAVPKVSWPPKTGQELTAS